MGMMLKMEEKLELLKEAKTKTLDRVVNEFGKGFGELAQMKLSIWDIRTILYEEINKIAERVFKEDSKFKEGLFRKEFFN